MKTVLSPKELGAAIGVSESSLKRWADSGRLQVARTAGGHRRIHLTEAIRFVRSQGFSLERPAVLGLEEIETAPSSSAASDDPASALHAALLAGDAASARGLALAQFIEGLPLSLIIDRMIAPALRSIGEQWRHGEDGIMVEHRAADICNQILDRVRSLTVAGSDQCTAVGAAPAEDPYVLPSLMAASVLASEGWNEVNLSANTPMSVLARAAVEAEARLVWVALSAERSPAAIQAELRDLCDALGRAGLAPAIVAGGPALADTAALNVPGVYHARSMTELAAFAKGLRSSHAQRETEGGNPPA